MKKYRTGFIVGKFAPLHVGHQFLIETALRQCEELIILSYTSADYGKYSLPQNRKQWLDEFLNRVRRNTVVRAFVIDNNKITIPEDEDSVLKHREFCANFLLNELETTVQAVFTSESYGEGLAKYLSAYFTLNGINCPVESVNVDIPRSIFPISATNIRDMGWYKARDERLISPFVAAGLMPKILILGGESSGKTTLARELALHLGTHWVAEYGRELYEEKGGKLQYEDMELIAIQQLRDEVITAQNCDRLIVCDTSVLTTYFYSMQMFGRASKTLKKIALYSLGFNCGYDAVYLCSGDIPFIQDGTRKDEEFRDEAFRFYQSKYGDSQMIVVKGTIYERVKTITTDLENRGII